MSRPVHLLGVPTDYGASRRGVNMGPSAIRYAGLVDAVERLERECTDEGDLAVPNADRHDPGDPDAKFLAEIRRVSTDLAGRVDDVLDAGGLPLVLGGDHSLAIGSLSGTARDADVGVLWFDAHGDSNTPETTPSGNVHGMSLAAALGLGAFGDDRAWAQAPGLDPEDVALVGLRDLDPGEQDRLRELPVAAYTMSDIDERGVTAVVDEALSRVDAPDGVHVSLDLDWIDPGEAPGVGTPVRGGATYREAHAAMELVAERTLRSLELVEVNPILDRKNATAELAVGLVASALGERTL